MALRPFLKWVGGKRQLLPVLRRFYPDDVGTYFEPFLGSGAVFFDLHANGRLNGGGAVLTDDNPDLIGCYRRVRESVDEVLAHLDRLTAEHTGRGRECYMQVRDERFNPQRAAWHAAGADPDTYPTELAAMLIYLNRTGYNGLFRVNSSNEFNVPPGRYDRPRIVDRKVLLNAARALSAANIRIERAGYAHVRESAKPGDFVYLDPPYAPLTPTANFRSYTRRGFSDADQRSLQQLVIGLAERGVHVLLSNSVAPAVAELYEHHPNVAAAGLRAYRVPARRAINSRPDRRGAVEELVVTNINVPAPSTSELYPAAKTMLGLIT